MIDRTSPTLSTDQVACLLRVLRGVDSVELKLSVPDTHRASAVTALGLDPLRAQLRQVAFFDTPDLALDRSGLVVRARRVQGKAGDAVVKLRPLDPDQVPAALRRTAGFGVEVDAMPGGFVCSGTLKARVDDEAVREAFDGRRPLRSLLTKEQRSLLAGHAPAGVDLDGLAALGPVNVLKLKFTPAAFPRRVVAEQWHYPDGSRLLELSVKCEATEAFDVAAAARTFLAEHGIDAMAQQHTKTRAALRYFTTGPAAPPTTLPSGPGTP